MLLIQLVAVCNPVGNIIKDRADKLWYEWIARIFFSGVGIQYENMAALQPKVAEMIYEVNPECDLSAVSAQLRVRGKQWSLNDEQLKFASRVARLIWNDAMWGYGVCNWSPGSYHASIFVAKTYGSTWESGALQMPKEYALLEKWLGELALQEK